MLVRPCSEGSPEVATAVAAGVATVIEVVVVEGPPIGSIDEHADIAMLDASTPGGGVPFMADLRLRPPASNRISSHRYERYTAVMSKRLVDIDDELLEEATAVLGASTMKEAVNRSLEQVVLAARRRRHADRLSAMRDLDLADPEVMAGAWR